MARYEIFKHDKWNMIVADVLGTKIEVREISTEWGEEKHIFHSRPELLHWVAEHFKPEDYIGREVEYEQIIKNFKKL